MNRNAIRRRDFVKLTSAAMTLPTLAGRTKLFAETTSTAGILAATPPMGWNSFDSYGVYLHERAALANVDAMAETLKPFGYEYFVIDNGWFGQYQLIPGTIFPAEKHASDVKINEFGLLQPSDCYFPNGLKPVVDRCRANGLKFGVHLMRGIPRKAVAANTPIQGTKYHARDVANPQSVCRWCDYNYGVDMSKPGAQEFYNSLVNQLADWGIDFIKADDIVPFPQEVEAMAKAIDQCGRPIVLSLSPGGSVDPEAIESFRTGNMLRVTRDIWDDQNGIDECFDAWRKWQGKERPGFWVDMDMIPFGQLGLMAPPQYASSKGHGGKVDEKEGLVALSGKGTTRWSLFTRPQMLTFITLRAVSASPLMIGGDLPSMDKFSLSLLTNPEMLACNQNGVMGSLLSDAGQVEVWKAAKKNAVDQGWVGVFNRSPQPVRFDATAPSLGLDAGRTYAVLHVWGNNRLSIGCAAVSLDIPEGGAVFLKYQPK